MQNKPERLGLALIVSGPSGTGKSTVCNLLRKRRPDLKFSVSCTTRPPRPNEKDTKEYYFLSQDEFDAKIADNQFIEYATVHGNSYGTLRSEIMNRVIDGEDVLLDIDVQGALQIKEFIKDDQLLAKCVEFAFIAPPSFAELENRLRSRATETEDAIAVRLTNSKSEFEAWNKYDFLIINKDIDEAVDDMEKLIHILHQSTKRLKLSGFFK